MARTATEQAYLTAAVENASPAGLVIMLFDLLIKDLKSAISAMEKGDIEKRTTNLKHGFLVLEQLQTFVDSENGGEAATNFLNFYSSIQSKMVQAQFEQNDDTLQRQIELLQDVRQAWQQVAAPEPAAS